MDCLAQSCAASYLDQASFERRSMVTLFGETSVLAPYVIATIVGPNGTTITVGNASSPLRDNHAVIKSFQYGRMDGVGCELEIIDEEGGDFKLFFDRIVNSFAKAADKYQLRIEWGWVGTSCNNYPIKLSTTKPHTFLITKVNIKVDSVITFMLEGTDLLQVLFEGRVEKSYGTDDAKIELKDAIRQLLKENNPPITDVQFLRRNPSGGPPTEWEFRGDTRNSYRADQQHALATIMRWIRPYVTTEGKGIIPAWDDTKDHPAIILWEDASPPCNKLAEDNRRVGSYIVNGGNCLYGFSSVLTGDGWKRIDNMVKHKYSGLVRCVDENGDLTWGRVTNWFRSLRHQKKLKKLHLNSSRSHYRNISGAVFTDDHKVLTNYGYVEIKDLASHHKINTGTLRPINKCYEAFIGTMLGDSYITCKSNKFACAHGFAQETYLRHKASLFGLKVTRRQRSYLMHGPTTRFVRRMATTFYPNGKKIIPVELLEDFSIVSLAYLFMDDGNMHLSQQRSQIAVCSFEDEDVDRLVARIKELGIDCKRKKYGGYNRIIFNKESSRILSEKISPYVIPELQYKLLPEHQNNEMTPLTSELGIFYDDFTLLDVPELEAKSKYVYCIEVDQGNFLTHSGIAHNCSSVLSFTPEIKWSFAAAANTGGNVSTVNSENLKQQNINDCDVSEPGAGTATYNVIPDTAVNSHGKEAGKEMGKNDKPHHRASRHFANYEPVKAELRIVGDPTLDNPIELYYATIGIVYINPIHLTKAHSYLGTGCANWTSVSTCNPILSNRQWYIQGWSHDIREGSYTTTLRVYLPPSGATQAKGEPLGANSSGEIIPTE